MRHRGQGLTGRVGDQMQMKIALVAMRQSWTVRLGKGLDRIRSSEDMHGTVCAALGRRACRGAKFKAGGSPVALFIPIAARLDRIREISDADVKTGKTGALHLRSNVVRLLIQGFAAC